MFEEINLIQVSLEELKIFFPKKEALYKLLEGPHYNFVYPMLKSSAITVQYLLDVASGMAYTISKNKYSRAPELINKSQTINDLLELLQKIVKQDLGFKEGHLSNKEWVLNCIYSEEQSNEIFLKDDFVVFRAIPKQ